MPRMQVLYGLILDIFIVGKMVFFAQKLVAEINLGIYTNNGKTNNNYLCHVQKK